MINRGGKQSERVAVPAGKANSRKKGTDLTKSGASGSVTARSSRAVISLKSLPAAKFIITGVIGF